MVTTAARSKNVKAQVESRGSIVLTGVSWEAYEGILDAFGDRRLRHTYVDGALEIMSPLHIHEYRKRLIGRMIEMLTWRLQISMKSAGSTTLRKKLKRRGLEPDECYYIANEPLVRGRDDLDLRKDPPPDLAIEVDVTHKSLDRLEVYAKLGVPEIWRHDGQILEFLKLSEKGQYAPLKRSIAFPRVTPKEILRFLSMTSSHEENAIMNAVVEWVDQKLK